MKTLQALGKYFSSTYRERIRVKNSDPNPLTFAILSLSFPTVGIKHWNRLTPFFLFFFFSFLLSQKNLKFKMCIKTRRILHYADFKIVRTVAYKCSGKQCFGGKLLQFYITFVFVNKFSCRTFVATLVTGFEISMNSAFVIIQIGFFKEKFVFKT